MIRATGLLKQYGSRVLFADLDWQIGPGQRIALVGANGAGKSTLAKVLAGKEHADSGEVLVPRGWRVGYLEQEVDPHDQASVLERTVDALHELQAVADEVEVLLHRVSVTADPADLEALGHKQAQLETAGWYSADSRARRILAGLGFRDSDCERSVSELSGGWRMRVSLARLLLRQPDLLLLDEPTNHLDLETLVWFEGYLQQWQGSIVVISHDRAFINRIATHVGELRNGRLRLYPGNYDQFTQRQAEERDQLEKQAAGQQRRQAEMQSFVDRFRAKASKASAVQSRVKMLEKMEQVEFESDAPALRGFRFPQPPRSGKEVVVLDGIQKRYGDQVVYSGLDFTLRRGDKVALVGPNGAGKSTLLKILAGVLEPDGGQRKLGHNVTVRYFAQHQLEQLDPSNTVYDELMSVATDESAGRVRSILGAFLFQGDDVKKRVSVLSGGEKSRVALAKMLLEPANFILLDEPTNHLDMAALDALEQSLAQYEGTLAIISHDRHFLNAVATATVDVRGGRVERYEGPYDEYLAEWERRERAAAAAAAGEAARLDDGIPKNRRDLRRMQADLRNAFNKDLRPQEKRLSELETRIESLESRIASMTEKELADGFYQDTAGVQAHFAEKSALQSSLDDTMSEWEALGEAIEARRGELESQLAELAE